MNRAVFLSVMVIFSALSTTKAISRPRSQIKTVLDPHIQPVRQGFQTCNIVGHSVCFEDQNSRIKIDCTFSAVNGIWDFTKKLKLLISF